MAGKLTAAKVKNLSPGMNGDGDGLWLRVITKERRAWVFCYQRHGKAREMGLGGCPDVSLAEAPEKVQAGDGKRRRVRRGLPIFPCCARGRRPGYLTPSSGRRPGKGRGVSSLALCALRRNCWRTAQTS